ncbi:MAG: hypothetical protein K2H34_10715 [Lachnospiraceae bacterium]|nr:hypothetical protein [Lachnospiraceae bacterium]
MKRKQNHLGLYIVTMLILVMGVAFPRMIAFAGGINSNEAGVIAAASGTFSYDGKTYQAGSAYINSLTSYLAADDVDLTAEQASEAISMMYANVAEGVAQGYLYEVGGQTESTSEEATIEGNGKDKDKIKEEKDPEKEKSDDKLKEDNYSNLDVWEAMSNQTEAKEKLENRPDKKDASASVQMDENDIVITTKDNQTISISKKEQLISDKTIMVIDGISGIILAITLICGVILFMTKCMSFKRPESRRARRGHSKRRKIRRYTRNVLTVTTMLCLIGIFVLLGSYISLFNKDAIMQNMQSSGYFRYAYSEYISGMAEEAKDKLAAGGDISDIEQIVSYEDYLFTIKQNSLKILEGETNIRVPDSNVTPYIYNMRNSYMRLFCVAGVFIIVSAICGIVLMIFMDQRRERGIKHFAFAQLAASVVLIGATVVMTVNKPYLHIYIEPDYLYLFLMEYIQWTVKVMTSISAFCVVLGMILVGVYKTILNNQTE